MSAPSIHTEGTIIVFRPLYELKNHITNFEVPNIYLLARVVKTCALAIFRGHFYETDTVAVRDAINFFNSWDGSVKAYELDDINQKRHFAVESAAIFAPKVDQFKDRIQFVELKNIGPLSLTNVMTYLRDTLKDQGFGKGLPLWNNDQFTRVSHS